MCLKLKAKKQVISSGVLNEECGERLAASFISLNFYCVTCNLGKKRCLPVGVHGVYGAVTDLHCTLDSLKNR